MQSLLQESVIERLNGRLMGHGRVRKGQAGRRLRGVFAALSVDVKQRFGPRIIRFEFAIPERPRRRYAVLVPNFVEVTFAQTQERRAVDF